MNYRKLLTDFETHLREGRGHVVANALGGLSIGAIPREFRQPLANVCRRSNLLTLGLKILSPLMSAERTHEPTPPELAEYAVLLERSGAVNEALRTLRGVETPEAPLYRAFCHFKSWDYAAAIPDLESYISGQVSPYGKMVGYVNLAAALVAERRFEPALARLEANIKMAHEHGFTRLMGNCSELRAQVYLALGDYARTREELNEAFRIFAFEETFDQFFVHKWQTILKAIEERDVMGLIALRSLAHSKQDWETVREADLFRLQVKFDETLLTRLYLGTPFAGYRRRIESMLNCRPRETELIVGDANGRILDLSTGSLDGEDLNRGKLLHRAMVALTRDLYRPLRVGGLFAELYPDERFDVYSSPGRVHHLQFRLREWFNERSIPAQLTESDGWYSLSVGPKLGVRLATAKVDGWSSHWKKLEASFDRKSEITAAEVRELLDMKPSSCKRFLNWATREGRLQRHGSNNATHYKRAA